ncbi:helix-turn-helix transcriptional regulator [Ilumatobacter sp.]|uniref:helix-turn-helix transcriptional regulator n=1 Tax=Ilumatobacter sp. TaxID=1967498 RepID=UPI003C679811
MDAVQLGPSPTQRRVLAAVKRQGEVTAGELATILEISSSAARQHLAALRVVGLVEARQERGHAGRPADHYHATEQAEPFFGATDGDLSIELLGFIEDEDPELVGRVFDRRRRRLVDEALARLDGASTAERVRIVADLLDAQGYLADFEELDGEQFRINLHNCAMWSVASRYGQACSSELDFMRDLMPGATVQRVAHKTGGAHACVYEISVAS